MLEASQTLLPQEHVSTLLRPHLCPQSLSNWQPPGHTNTSLKLLWRLPYLPPDAGVTVTFSAPAGATRVPLWLERLTCRRLRACWWSQLSQQGQPGTSSGTPLPRTRPAGCSRRQRAPPLLLR